MTLNPNQPFARCLRGFALILAAIAALVISPVFAQSTATGTVTGRIINEATGEYLRNANVSVAGTNISTVAEAGGYYRLAGVPAGSARIIVSYTGLDTKEVPVEVVAGQAVTQDVGLTSGVYGDIVRLDQVQVSTSREGNARAIMEQRNAPNPKKVISADAIGNVSEGNVGEFLKLMPGVVMDYVEADTRSVRVRGLNPKYANVLLDGMQLASAGSSNVGTGRAYEFEQLSINSVETVELTKNPTPDQPSSVAGTVNLRTRGAFDRKGRHISFLAGYSANSYYMDSPFEAQAGWDDRKHHYFLPNYAFDFSDVIMDGKLGITAGFSHNATVAAQKHIWFWMDAFPVNANLDTYVPEINWIWLQDGPKPTERDNYQVRLDYRPNSDWHLYGRVGFNTYDARFYNRTLSLRPTRQTATNSFYAPGATRTDMTVVSGRISTDSNQFMTKEGDTLTLSGGAYYDIGTFSADLGLQYVRQKNYYGNREYGHFTDFSSSINNVSWRMTRPSPGSDDVRFTQLTGANWRDIRNYRFDANSIGWHERDSKDERSTIRLDFKNLLSGDVKQTLKYGAMTTSQDYRVRRYGLLRTNPTGPDGTFGNADDPLPSEFVDPNFRAHWDFTANMNDWPALSPWLIHQDYLRNPNRYRDDAANATNRAQNNWFFEEKIHAAYVQDIIEIGQLEIAPGLRYEYTDSSGRGVNRATNQPISGGSSYDSLLYYLQGSYDFTRDLVLRGSYHTAITRADIANLVPGISAVNDADRILTASNPNLKEEQSQTLEMRLEYYFNPVGALSVSVFETHVKDRQATTTQDLGPGGYLGDAQYANWRLNSTFNVGATTKYRGLEIDYSQQLSFLPKPFNGAGVFGNFTRLDYDNYAYYYGSPKWIANGGVSYDYGRFGGRLNANYVGKILNTVSNGFPEYQRDRLQLDLNLEFQINHRFTLFADARNLTNEPSQYTYRGTEDNFIRILKTGTIWMFGVKGQF